LNRLLVRSSLRHLARHPLLTSLSVLGIAVGIAVVVSIDLANGSARRAFALSSQGVTGRATDQVVGGPTGLDESIYVALRRDLGVAAAAPVVEGYATTPREPGRALRILGVDPFVEAPFRTYVAPGVTTDLRTFLTRPGAALMSTPTAVRLGLVPGSPLPIAVEGVKKEIVLVGHIDLPGELAVRALEDLIVTDVATAQELLDQPGKLSRIDLIFADSPEGAALRERVAGACVGRCEVTSAASRALATAQMTRAFHLNLSALSLLALVVGMFLIYNTVTFSVVQRRPLLGTLRALGVTRGEVFALVAREALLLAVPAMILGLGLGIALAHELLRLVTRTINDLYFVVNVRTLDLDVSALAKAAALGLLATLVAAFPPAREATLVPPSLTLRRSSSETALAGRAARLALVGTALGGASMGALGASARSLSLAYIGLAGLVLGAALVIPWATRLLAVLARPAMGRIFGMLGKMAARGIVASLTRTSIALAALTVAVATTVGVDVMVHSFRATVVEWLTASLQSDIFVQPPSLVSGRGDGTLLPQVIERVSATDGVLAVSNIRNRRVRAGGGEVALHVPVIAAGQPSVYRFRTPRGGDARRLLAEGDVIAVSEPYAFHHGLDVGQTIDLGTDRGAKPFRVVGVYADYASDEGGILMSRPTYERHFDDRRISALGLVAKPGVDLGALRERVRARAGDEQVLVVRANRELLDASLAIFDRTFAVTEVLRLLSVGVAFIGILSALSALALERSRELAVLRAIGLTPRQLFRLVTLQTSLMGLFAGLFSLPLGLVLAYVLVFVINRRSFGWTLELALSPGVAVKALVLSLLAAVLAGLYPAFKMSRANPVLALRDE
jgi:putative ABC transport system permease protein